MSWLETLYETYDKCKANKSLTERCPLTPPFHVLQQAHIQIVIDGKGLFRRASVVEKEDTPVPATERSATARTSAVVPHGLCDHVKYCAADYLPNANEYFVAYQRQLQEWCNSPHSHPKAVAVLNYINNKTVLKDLIHSQVMPIDVKGRLVDHVPANATKPALLKVLTATNGVYKPQNALIRWVVEELGNKTDLDAEVWKNKSVQDSWIAFMRSQLRPGNALCMVTGAPHQLATKHPGGVRGGKDKAKLISNKTEDESDFVYLGRFHSAAEACGVSLEVSLKAHNALAWLIRRQGFRNGDQSFVAWTVSGKAIPDPYENSAGLFLGAEVAVPSEETQPDLSLGDLGQYFSLQLKKAVRGYKAHLDATDDVFLLGIDSAVDGRASITTFRKMANSDFLARVESWHLTASWLQHFRKQKDRTHLRFIGAPSLKNIADAGLGFPNYAKNKSLQKQCRAIVERLTPCVIDGIQSHPIPFDIVRLLVNRACNGLGFKRNLKKRDEYEWEECLGITCAAFRSFSFSQGKEFSMALEAENCSRDYLFGRLLAIADGIESYALNLADERRDTNSARLMQRFSDHPLSTWKTIELGLIPYKSQLRRSRNEKAVNALKRRERLLDEVMCQFQPEDFNDNKLSGEFLLGYHCQRHELLRSRGSDSESNADENQRD